MYASRRIHLERGLPIVYIISKIVELLKDTNRLIEFEEQIKIFTC